MREVWGVVSDYYLDARGGGFDQGAWAALRDRYLEQPLPTHEAAYRWGRPPSTAPGWTYMVDINGNGINACYTNVLFTAQNVLKQYNLERDIYRCVDFNNSNVVYS